MDKITYLAELAEGLARWVPERERQDILRYYAEYFEEAGADREAEVVAELGDPWALSCRLAVEGGYVTQEQAMSWTPRKKKRWSWVLAMGITAAVLIFVVGQVAFLAAQTGRTFGRMVSDYVTGEVSVPNQATVIEGAEYVTDFGRISQDQMGNVYIEGGLMPESYWTMEDGCLERFDSIDVDVGLANVLVTAADDYTLFINQSEKLGGYELTWEVKGGTLKIRDGGSGHFNVNSWGELQNLFEGGQWKVDVVITVPETLLDQVKIRTGTGSVYLADVFAKKIEAETGLGNVECYDPHEVKKLDLESGTGSIFLGIGEMYGGLDIDLESGVGSIEASLGCYERDCAYKLESGIGTVSVDGVGRGKEAERKGNTSYKLNAESGTGDVAVYFW